MEVPKGKNLKRVGWRDGWLTAQFKNGGTYSYGPNVPKETAEQILRNPYPDRLFELKVKKIFQCKKLCRACGDVPSQKGRDFCSDDCERDSRIDEEEQSLWHPGSPDNFGHD